MIMPRYVYEWPHAKTWPQLVKGKGKATDGGDGSGGIERWMTTKLTSVQLRQAITKLVVTCDLPFRIVEAEALLILLNRNCAQKNFIPSRWTVSRDTVVYAAAALQSSVAEMPAKEGEVGCRVSFTIDMWTAPNNTAWLVVTGHWIDENFQLRTMVFEFREIHGRHTGKQLARVVEETVVHWGLEKRCLGFTSDNASSNTAAFRWMSEEGGGQCFFNSRMHFRVFRHLGRNEATAVVKERETELTAVRGELAAHKVEVDELHRMLTVLEEKNKATAAVVEERERDLEAVKRELVTVNGELAMVKGELAVVRGGLAECKVAMTEQWVESSRASAVNGLGEKSSKRRRVVTVEKDLELNIELEIRRCTGDRKKALEVSVS
ncbi:unnamed protein product [Closterium sp. NIES-65]|nr:unnamed protein product [Closterium sp. NIES-65]